MFAPLASGQKEGFVGVLEIMYPSVSLATQPAVGEYCIFCFSIRTAGGGVFLGRSKTLTEQMTTSS